MHCLWCGTGDLKASRFRSEDTIQLLAMQYPVRCLECMKRDYRNLFGFLAYLASRKAHEAGWSFEKFPPTIDK
jgi:hypothetical protein